MPTSRSTRCPGTALLRRFLAEQMDESEEAEVQEHIGACTACQAALEGVAGAPDLWSDLREQLTEAPAPEAPARGAQSDLEDLVELLGPTDDPRMLGRLGGYEVCGLIGRGTTGLVLKALEPRLNRYVAIKLMSPGLGSNGSARRRFEREGRAVAAVCHEHVVPIHAVDEHRGLPYIVMKYIPGLSLEQRIERDGPFDTCGVTRVGLQVAQGLAAAHAQGIVHRDVKPANVILEDTVERAMVTDFGLARVADEASMTRSGTITGTPQYMSPEQARGDGVDPRSDLFSLGSLMYAACTGRPPFRAETVFGVINRVNGATPRPIREINPTIDGWLASFIDKLMSKDPEHRFQSATEVANALSNELAHLQNPTAAARPPRPWLPSADPSSPGGRRRLVGLASLTVGALAVGGWLLSRSSDSPDGSHARASLLMGLADGDERLPTLSTSGLPVFELKELRTLPVGAAGSLRIDVPRGDVELSPGRSGSLQVTILRRVAAKTRKLAAGFATAHEVRLMREGDDLSLGVFPPAGALEASLEHVRYRVELPKGFDADVRTTGGSISIATLAADVGAEAHGGDIRFARVTGSIWARTENGSIDVPEGCEGQAELFAVGGDVHLAGALVGARIRTSNGDVYLGESPGTVTAQTSGGDVFINGIEGPTSAHAEDGDVLARVTRDPGQNAGFSATHGDVTVHLGVGVAATIEAAGKLTTSLPFEAGDAGEPWSVIHLNGGGSTIRASSTTGTVTIARLDPAAGSGGSGLGGSGSSGGPSGRDLVEHSPSPPVDVRDKTSGSPRPGALVTVPLDDPVGNMDGYTLYLPVSHDRRAGTFAVLIYLQGGYGVGGPIGNLNNWGLPRLLRDERDLSTERNRLLLDEFIVVSPHIQAGQYFDEAPTLDGILKHVLATYKADPERIYLTGLSRGGHGTWGLASRLSHGLAAIAPVGGNAASAGDFAELVDTSIWIAHNKNDGVVPFAQAAAAARRIEQASGVEFLRAGPSTVATTDYLGRKFVFTSTPNGGHDAWTDLYSNPEFYRWLLRQRRTPATSAPQLLAPGPGRQQAGAPDGVGPGGER
jgi:serine/threonine protein kinase/DUF4097 and DUF4098 domain-containing protein YvlB/predicted esterase